MSSLPISRPIYNPDLSRPVRDEPYKKWVRTLPCCICGATFGVEAAHTGTRGLGQLADDKSAIPLCHRHHDRKQPYSYHSLGPAKFQAKYGINIAWLVGRLNNKPRIVIYGSVYVALIDGLEWPLHPIKDGLVRSQRAVIATCQDVRREWLRDFVSSRR